MKLGHGHGYMCSDQILEDMYVYHEWYKVADDISWDIGLWCYVFNFIKTRFKAFKLYIYIRYFRPSKLTFKNCKLGSNE